MVFKETKNNKTETKKVIFKKNLASPVQDKRNKDQEIIFNQISSNELVRFLNSHERLGMTHEQQEKYIDMIDIVSDKIARKISVVEAVQK